MPTLHFYLQSFLLTLLCPILILSSPPPTSYHQIPLNVVQTYQLLSNLPVNFKIDHSHSSVHGTYTIFVNSIKSETSQAIVVSRQQCHKQEKVEYRNLSEEGNEEFSKISFIGNPVEENCFQVETVGYTNNTLEFSVQVSFAPFDDSQDPSNLYATIELITGVEKELLVKIKDPNTEIFHVSLNGDSKGSHIEIKVIEGVCLKGTGMAWLCYLPPQQETAKFILYNTGPNEIFQIKVTEIKIQNVLTESSTIFNPTIPGFGTLFKVEFQSRGVLKLIATSENEESLPIIASSSLNTMFSTLAEGKDKEDFYDYKTSKEDLLIVQSKEAGKILYCFVQSEAEESFNLTSYFIKQATVEIGSENMYFIDPEIYEYQYIEFKLGNRSFPEKFEIIVESLQTDSLMNLYYDTNINGVLSSSIFPDSQFYRKKAANSPVNCHQLSISFVAGTHDISAYITIHALTKGIYSVKGVKVAPRSLWQGIFILGFLSLMIVYIFSCFSKIFKLSKSNEFDDLPEWMDFNISIPSRSETASQQEEVPAQLEIEIPNNEVTQTGIEIESNEALQINDLENIKKLMNMSRKLRRQARIEKKERLRRQRQLQELQEENVHENDVDFIDEEDKCDICFEGKKTVVFDPCQHNCTCSYCALIIVETSAKCPLCRAQIEKVTVSKNVEEKKQEKDSADIKIEIIH